MEDDGDPVKGLERNPEPPRSTYLIPEQIERLLGAIADHPDQVAANALRLLLLTGARSSEVFRATWSEFDLTTGTWTKPITKQGTEHRVPLSQEACEMLVGMRSSPDARDSSTTSIFVFPAAKGGGPLKTVRHDWAAICKAAKLEGVRVHDLRHSYASLLASAGLSLPIIGALLGHRQASTTFRYAHLLDKPLREATGRVGAVIRAAETGRSGEVVEMLPRGHKQVTS